MRASYPRPLPESSSSLPPRLGAAPRENGAGTYRGRLTLAMAFADSRLSLDGVGAAGAGGSGSVPSALEAPIAFARAEGPWAGRAA